MKCPLTKKECYQKECMFWVIEEYEDGEKEEYCAIRNMLVLVGYALSLWIDNLETLNEAIRQSMEESEETEEESEEEEGEGEEVEIIEEVDEEDEPITVNEEDLQKFLNQGGEDEG